MGFDFSFLPHALRSRCGAQLLVRNPCLRVVVLSATMNAAAIAAFFRTALRGAEPSLTYLPPAGHIVRESYLEDVAAELNLSDAERLAVRRPFPSRPLFAKPSRARLGYSTDSHNRMRVAEDAD